MLNIARIETTAAPIPIIKPITPLATSPELFLLSFLAGFEKYANILHSPYTPRRIVTSHPA